MSTDEVQVLKRAVNDLRDEVAGMRGTLSIIHKAVLGMTGKTYVPGPSIWKRLMGWIGFMGLG